MGSKQKSSIKNFDSVAALLRVRSFDVQERPGVANQVEVWKYGCSAVLGRTAQGGVALVAGPGYRIGGERATLVDRGFQKFLVTGKGEVAATADRLRALHAFQEELGIVVGGPEYYNLALGTVSERYVYDRVEGRETPEQTAAASH